MSRMKRQLTCFLLCIILGTILLSSASASIIAGAKVSGDWEYTVSGKEAKIVYYNGNFKTDVTIPSKLGGKKVTSIAWGAFGTLPKLQSITIPDSVTTIADEAFLNCPALRTVTIGKGVKNIEGNPFDGCTNLRNINIASNHPYLQLIDGVLFTKDPMRLVCYPASKTQSSYTLPDGVVEIGDSAFSPNNSIKTLVVPSSVTKIHSTAFNTGNGGKKSITLDVTQNAYAKSYAVDKNMRYIENLPQETAAPSTDTSDDSYQVPTRENQYALYHDHRFGEEMLVEQLNYSLPFLKFKNASLCLQRNSDGILDFAAYYFPRHSDKASGQKDYETVESQLEQIYADLPTSDGHGGTSSMLLILSELSGGGEISGKRRYDQEYGVGIEHVLMKWGEEYRHFVSFEVYNMENFRKMVPLLESVAETATATPAPTATSTPAPTPTSTATLAPTKAPTADNRVIYQNDWATITFTEFAYNKSRDIFTLKAVVENASNTNAAFRIKNVVCNGWSIDDSARADVPANAKARAEFKFFNFGKDSGISDVGEIESFRFDVEIVDSSTYKDLQKLTGPFEIDASLF